MALGHGAARLDEQGVRGQDDYSTRVFRERRFKVWVNAAREIEALYDLEADLLERTDLKASERGDVREALARFEKIIAATMDARPQYRKRKTLPWDRKPGTGKKKRRR